jgi:hypothetical protein
MPKTELEEIGEHEVTVAAAERSQATVQQATEASAGASLGTKDLGVQTALKATETRTLLAEMTGSKSETLKQRPHIARITRAAAGNCVHWDFVRTPTFPLDAGFEFSVRLLVERATVEMLAKAVLGVTFDGWGRVEARAAVPLKLVRYE